MQAPAPTTADAQPASSGSLVQNGSINGIPVWAYGVMGMLAGLIVLAVGGRILLYCHWLSLLPALSLLRPPLSWGKHCMGQHRQISAACTGERLRSAV